LVQLVNASETKLGADYAKSPGGFNRHECSGRQDAIALSSYPTSRPPAGSFLDGEYPVCRVNLLPRIVLGERYLAGNREANAADVDEAIRLDEHLASNTEGFLCSCPATVVDLVVG
jgi:hypothetical protein